MDFPFTGFIPRVFPIEFLYLVTPFWADINIERGMGNIGYQVYSTGSPLLDTVNTFISDERDFNFNGRWMLLSEWNNVFSFFTPTNEASFMECRSLLISMIEV